MYRSNSVASLRLGIVERVSRYTFRGVPCDEFDRLHNAVYDFMFDARVLAFSVLTDENSVDIVIGSLESWNG